MRLKLPLVVLLLLLFERRVRILWVCSLVRPSLQGRHILSGGRECELRPARPGREREWARADGETDESRVRKHHARRGERGV